MRNIYAFADEASGQISGQIAAMRRNGLQGPKIRGVDGQNISDITVENRNSCREANFQLSHRLIRATAPHAAPLCSRALNPSGISMNSKVTFRFSSTSLTFSNIMS